MCWLVVFIFLLGHDVHSFRVQFFNKPNFLGFIREFELGPDDFAKCIEVKNSPTVESLKAEGCIMVYSKEGCTNTDKKDFDNATKKNEKLPWGSLRIEENTPVFPWYQPDYVHKQQNFAIPRTVSSFHRCSNEIGGGTKVDLDIYKLGYNLENPIESFCDIGGCTNLPMDAVNNVLSINNWGHSMDFFEKEDCDRQLVTVVAGDNYDSRILGKVVSIIRSFRPTDYLNRIQLHASILSFHFKNQEKADIYDDRLARDLYLRSSGSAQLVQDIEISSTVAETMVTRTSRAFHNTYSVKVDFPYSVQIDAGVPFTFSNKLKHEFGVGYQYTRTNGGETTNWNYTDVVNEETMTFKQTITVPPCTECKVAAFRKVRFSRFPFQCTARMIGMYGKHKASAADVKANLLPAAEYIRNIGDFTVEVYGSGLLDVEFGTSAYLNVDCTSIPGCVDTATGSLYRNSTTEAYNSYTLELPVTKLAN